jgi:flavin reductase (DIM6/NTAB) family NADH-FMN oxidoreductase RutF
VDHDQGRHGAVNAAPFSFFNVFGSDPATVGVGIGSKGPREPKDTRLNIRANEQFVVNLVPFSLAQEMRITSIAFPKGVDEAKEAKLNLARSERVEVPRIAQAPVSMECTLMQEIRLGGFSLVLGQICWFTFTTRRSSIGSVNTSTRASSI